MCTIHLHRTEGSGGVWERLHYDWSNPDRVVLTTTDANVWGGASGHTYTFRRRRDGMTDIDVAVVRDGKNLKGRILSLVLGTIGRRGLERAFEVGDRASEHGSQPFRGSRSLVKKPGRITSSAMPSLLRGHWRTTVRVRLDS